MVSTRSSILLIAATCTLVLQGHVDASPCDADNYSKVAAAVQTLHANCASWTAYLASGGVWTCDSTCHDAVINLVDTLPDCTFGGPYGQNYKQVVEGMVATCAGQVSSTSVLTEAPSSTTSTPSATTAAPTSNTANNGTETTTSATTDTLTATTDGPTATASSDNDNDKADGSASSSGIVGEAGTPASDVSTTSGANTQTVTFITALVLVVAGALLH